MKDLPKRFLWSIGGIMAAGLIYVGVAGRKIGSEGALTFNASIGGKVSTQDMHNDGRANAGRIVEKHLAGT